MGHSIDREKVIKGLECCNYYGLHEDCPYDKKDPNEEQDTTCMMDLMRDALALLKEKEAFEPKTGQWIYKKYDDMFMCSSCEKYSIRNDYPYCHWCGAKMEGRSVK